jgi:hypothetical protein
MTDQRFGFTPPSGFGPTSPLVGGDLTAVVASLLGLLQGQAAPSPFAGFGGTAPGAPSHGLLPSDDERRANEAFLRDLAAASLRKLYRYLESAAPRHGEIATCYPVLHQAIRAYRARDYGQALSASHQVYRLIAALQSRHLDLPDVTDEATAPVGEAAPPPV